MFSLFNAQNFHFFSRTGTVGSKTKFDIMELVEGAEAMGIDMDDLKIEKNTNQESKSALDTKSEQSERTNIGGFAKKSKAADDDPTWVPKSEIKDPKFSCNYCKKAFSKATTLDRHLISHVKMSDSSEMKFESDALFSCNTCAKNFKNENTLNLHVQNHRSLKVHKCDLCEKSFLRDEDFKQHIIDAHTPYDELPIVCDICEWRFKRPEYLKTHLTREHEKGELPADSISAEVI